jgi:hypothetical protein
MPEGDYADVQTQPVSLAIALHPHLLGGLFLPTAGSSLSACIGRTASSCAAVCCGGASIDG